MSKPLSPERLADLEKYLKAGKSSDGPEYWLFSHIAALTEQIREITAHRDEVLMRFVTKEKAELLKERDGLIAELILLKVNKGFEIMANTRDVYQGHVLIEENKRLAEQVSQLTAEWDQWKKWEDQACGAAERLDDRVKRLRERMEGIAAESEWIVPTDPRLRNWKDVATRHAAEAALALAEDDKLAQQVPVQDRCPHCQGFKIGGLPYGHSCSCVPERSVKQADGNGS